MADMMTFPNTVEEFMEQYKIVDTEEIYTNGAELVPIFRMMQWFEHVKQLPSVQPERGTGAWIINDEYPQHCWCSECNHFFSLFDPKSIHFCPNCGSEMKTCVWKSQD